MTLDRILQMELAGVIYDTRYSFMIYGHARIPITSWLRDNAVEIASPCSRSRCDDRVQGMFDLKVLLLALNYFGIVVASLGILFFVPQIIKAIGVTDNMTVGWLTMIPYISGGVGLVTWGLVSDRMNERRWNLLAACAVSAIGLIIAGLTIGSWWAMVGLSDRHVRVLWLEGTVLGYATHVPQGHGSGGFYRLDQFPRQSRRLLRPLVCRCDQGLD
jgi:nitrate/nitrite transporter NarK